MAQTFEFSLVSPERELFSGQVDSVLVPGEEGFFEVLADHSPLMSTVSPGMLEIRDGDKVRKIYVRGGFADVTPAGLTILAELAVNESDLTSDLVAQEREAAHAIVDDSTSSADDELNAQRALEVLPAA